MILNRVISNVVRDMSSVITSRLPHHGMVPLLDAHEKRIGLGFILMNLESDLSAQSTTS